MKTLYRTVLLMALMALPGTVLAAEEKPEGTPAKCCAKAAESGDACAHSCCVEAAEKGEHCEACGGKNPEAS